MADLPKTEVVGLTCQACHHKWSIGLWYWKNVWEKGLWKSLRCPECGSYLVQREEISSDERT